ncbi:hypothetical protein BUY16_11340, partial [Staphylococcus chromogenes]
IDKEVLKNKKNNDVNDQLDAIISDHEEAVSTYKDNIDSSEIKKNSEIKKQDKEVQKLQQQIKSSFNDIKKGYDKKDLKQINKGRQELVNLEVNVNSTENQ